MPANQNEEIAPPAVVARRTSRFAARSGWDWLGEVLSRILQCAIEGFAAYGAAMSPGLLHDCQAQRRKRLQRSKEERHLRIEELRVDRCPARLDKLDNRLRRDIGLPERTALEPSLETISRQW